MVEVQTSPRRKDPYSNRSARTIVPTTVMEPRIVPPDPPANYQRRNVAEERKYPNYYEAEVEFAKVDNNSNFPMLRKVSDSSSMDAVADNETIDTGIAAKAPQFGANTQEDDEDDNFSVGTFRSLVSEQDKPRASRSYYRYGISNYEEYYHGHRAYLQTNNMASPRVGQKARGSRIHIIHTTTTNPSAKSRRSSAPLDNSYPLNRKDAKKRKEACFSSSKKQPQPSRRRKSSSSEQREAPGESPTSVVFNWNRLRACLPMDAASTTLDTSVLLCPTDIFASHRETERRRHQRAKRRKELHKYAKRLQECYANGDFAEDMEDSDDGIVSLENEKDGKLAPAVDKSGRRRVRFVQPLVTMVHERPKTDIEDIPMLYFLEEELDLLEEDRIRTLSDQFECSMDGKVQHSSRRQPITSYFAEESTAPEDGGSASVLA